MNTWRRGCESAACIEVDMNWMSACDTGACVEVGWTSACNDAACVEVQQGAVVKIRDSKDPGGPFLSFTVQEWESFKGGIKRGAFD